MVVREPDSGESESSTYPRTSASRASALSGVGCTGSGAVADAGGLRGEQRNVLAVDVGSRAPAVPVPDV
jgi:hypothetical protein